MKVKNPIVSIDGLELKEFDYIDIGAILDTSGAVPVVIKSLIFSDHCRRGQGLEGGADGRRRRRDIAAADSSTELLHCTMSGRCAVKAGNRSYRQNRN